MNLTDQLHAAVADPPPTSIDLDRLVASARRGVIRNRWLTGTAAVVAVGAIAATSVPSLAPSPWIPGSGEPPPWPVVSAGPDPWAPKPTERPELARARLTTALRAAFDAALPPGLTRTGWGVDGDHDGYVAVMDIGDGSGIFALFVSIRPARVPTDSVCPKAGCTLERRSDGGVEFRTELPAYRVAESYRPDGTLVQVSLNPPGGGAAPLPVTLDELMTIARTPALTLFP